MLRVVAIGGGTGLATVLRGLKHHVTEPARPAQIRPEITRLTAVVTVTDEGGSSGRLRRDLRILPPGDIRNCLVALAEDEQLLTQLFNYRFASGRGLRGHNLGNLLLAALTHLTHDFAKAVRLSSEVLAIRGEIFPATLTIAVKPVELAPNRIVSTTTYNGQFPGPLLRFKEGQPVTIDINNQTDTPEQLHWHGQFLSTDVDGAAEVGTPFIPAHGSRRITFVPKPSGYRFYHTHVRAGPNLSAGQYTGLVGPVYIEPKNNPGNYDREVFLTLKEFEPSYSRGGDMAMDFLLPAATVKELKVPGENAMKDSLAKGMPHGFEVGYGSFTINGRMLGSGEPIRVKQGERVLFHVLNGSATEIRSLALPGHTFTVVAMDGNPIPKPVAVPGLWLGTAERVSAIVEMNHPGIWIMGDMADDDRHHGMGIVVEYAGQKGKPQWVAPKPFHWDYTRFGNPGAAVPAPDQVFDLTFAKQNAADGGFNRWTINNVAFAMDRMHPMFRVQQIKRDGSTPRHAPRTVRPPRPPSSGQLGSPGEAVLPGDSLAVERHRLGHPRSWGAELGERGPAAGDLERRREPGVPGVGNVGCGAADQARVVREQAREPGLCDHRLSGCGEVQREAAVQAGVDAEQRGVADRVDLVDHHHPPLAHRLNER